MLFITSKLDTRFDLTAAGARGMWRSGLQIVIGALGLAAIVGSGGGEISLPPEVTIEPSSASVQVGASVTFTGRVSTSCRSPVTLQWCRSEGWGAAAPCIDLPGATGNTYTINGANLSDDGGVFTLMATCWDANLLWSGGSARLAVSPMPGLVYLDGDFPEDQWLVTLVPAAAQAGSWGTASRTTTGGNPGAYRAVRFNPPITLPPGFLAFHISLANAYDPATQGAINVLDFGTDCLGPAAGTGDISVYPVIEQAGRIYAAYGLPVSWSAMCQAPNWQRGPTASALDRFAFWREDYPDHCSGGDACRPDFSAAGAPIRFGFVTSPSTSGAPAGASVTLGIDNWTVTVWRK